MNIKFNKDKYRNRKDKPHIYFTKEGYPLIGLQIYLENIKYGSKKLDNKKKAIKYVKKVRREKLEWLRNMVK